jgi:hypothetical protein
MSPVCGASIRSLVVPAIVVWATRGVVPIAIQERDESGRLTTSIAMQADA